MSNYVLKLTCSNCGDEFTRRHDRVHDDNNFCKLKCRTIWHKENITDARNRPCEECGTDFIPRVYQLKTGQGRYCSQICARLWLSKLPRTEEWRRKIGIKHAGKRGLVGPENHRWKGGRYVDPCGYIFLNVGPNLLKPEHRHVMEQHVGRGLLSSEIVHHINEDKHDNRIENLMIVSRAEHIVIHIHRKDSEALKRMEQYDVV
jgi:hypothetical protein